MSERPRIAYSQWLPLRILAKRAEALQAQEQERIDQMVANANEACVQRIKQNAAEIARECDVLLKTLGFGLEERK